MAVTVVRASGYASAGATTGAIAFSNPAPTRGNLLVAFLSWKSTFSLTTTGWTLIDFPTANADGDAYATYYKVSDGTESSKSFAISASTDQASGTLFEITGQHPTAPINAHNLTNDMLDTPTRTAPTLTPTVGFCLGLYGANYNGAGVTAGCSFSTSVTLGTSNVVEFLGSGTGYEYLPAGTAAVSGRTITYNGAGTGHSAGSQGAVLIAPAATVSQQPATRRQGWLPRRRRTTAQPVRTAPVVTVQALPPQQATAVRHGWLPRKRARGTNYVPAQVVVVTTQALPPQTARDRLTPQPRRRTFTVTPVPHGVPLVPPQTVRDRLAPQPRRRRVTAAPPFTVTVTVVQPQARRRFPPLRAKARTAQPPVQVTLTVPAQARVVRRFPYRTKARTTGPVPTTVTVNTTQALPPQQATPVRHGWLPRRRARGTNFVPAQVVVATTQALPPQPARRHALPVLRRRPTVTVPTPTVRVTIPPTAARRRGFLPVRRAHVASVPVQITVTVPVVSRRRTIVLPSRRGHATQPVPVTVTVQALPPQPATRARRGWLFRRRTQTQVPYTSTSVTVIGGTVTSVTPQVATVGSTQPGGPSVTSTSPTAATVTGTTASTATVTSTSPQTSTVTSN